MPSITALAERLGQRLRERGLQVSCAESCTGGGIAEAITRIAGCSAWFEAGYVTYSNAQKTAQLGVPADLFAKVGAVSREVVEAMAQGALQRSGAQLAVAVSGIAGPGGGTADKPVGTIWLAWADQTRCGSLCCHFSGDRAAIRRQTIEQALEGLLALAGGEPLPAGR
ncbi:CinA family protein [Pseudomonas sp. NW5]|uniref:CinA family protein n=1 Tax=Pseudomonas sp. NW5 TaxID=2934934 RepID=UPI0020228B0B|nr:CinA family protein [Pseudomonas sp. NW5]MCL7462293.1 CinA family protein [Pseudomonas sp. NW5]